MGITYMYQRGLLDYVTHTHTQTNTSQLDKEQHCFKVFVTNKATNWSTSLKGNPKESYIPLNGLLFRKKVHKVTISLVAIRLTLK